MISNADLVEWVGDGNLFVDEENFGWDLPSEDEEWNTNNVPDLVEDDDLDVDDEIAQSELVGLLKDSRISSHPEEKQLEVEEETTEVVNGDNDSQSDEPSICEPEEESVNYDIQELISDEEGRPMWSAWAPERYNPSTGESYAHSWIKKIHNIISQTPTATLDYSDVESKVVAEILTYIKSQWNGKWCMLSRGLE